MTSATRTWTRLSLSRVKVSPADTPQQGGQLLRQDHSVVRQEHRHAVRPVAQGDEGASASWLGTTSTVQSTVYRSVSAEAVSRAAHQPSAHQLGPLQRPGHLRQLAGGHSVHQPDLGGIAVDLVVLPVHHVENGAPQAEGGDDQGSAAADAHHRHPEAALIAEQVAQGDLVVEGQPPPQGGDPLQQDALAHGGALGRISSAGTAARVEKQAARAERGHRPHRGPAGQQGGSGVKAVLDLPPLCRGWPRRCR